MRKFTFLILMLSFSVFAIAQQMGTRFQEKAISKKDVGIQTPSSTSTRSVQAVGDTIYYNDFSTPADWTIGNFSGDAQDFVFSTTGPTGAYSASMGPINSTTAANGFALFDGDLLGCNGCAQQNAYIETTDPIDLTGHEYISLVFQQYYRAYTNESCYIEVSTDHVNWTQFLFNTGMATGAMTANPKFMYYNISSAAGNQPQVWIRLHIIADWGYAWMIDDVAVVDGAANDLVMEDINPWFTAVNTAAATAYLQGYLAKVPYTQVPALNYNLAAFFNNGPMTQNHPKLNIKISDYSTDVFDVTTDTSYTTSDTISFLTTALRDTLFSTTPFVAPAELKNYKMTFTLMQDEVDANPATNVDTVSFSVSDTIFSHTNKYTGRIGADSYTGYVDGDFIGCKYTFLTDQEVSSISYYIHPETDTLTSFDGGLYAYDFAGQTWTLVISTDNYVIHTSDLGKWITLPLIKDGSSEFIQAETLVAAGMATYTNGIGNGYLHLYADNSSRHYFYGENLLLLGGSPGYGGYAPAINLNVVPPSSVPLQAYVTTNSMPSCNGDSDGSLTVVGAGGVPPYTYQWDTAAGNATTETVTGLVAGSYTVTVTDAFSDFVVKTFVVSEPVILAATVANVDWNLIDISVSGGTVPYTYSWSRDPVGFSAGTQDIDNLAPGAYTVTVTDAKGCTTTLTEVITNIINADSKAITVYPNPTNSVINIANAENSKITVYNILGESVVSISNNKTLAKIDISNLSEGTYIVRIISNNKTTTKRIYLVK